MPRNSSGTMILASGAFVPNTLISSSAVNNDLSDIANEITNSVATTGVSSMTGQFLSASGSANSPGISFVSDKLSGFYLSGTHQIGIATNGVQVGTFNSNQSVTWQSGATWAGSGSFTGTLGVTGATTLSSTLSAGNTTVTGTLGVTGATTLSSTLAAGNTTITGTESVSGKLSLTSTDSMALPNGSTGQRNGSPSTGDLRYNNTLSVVEYWNGSTWIELGKATMPTVQTFTSGSANYTPTAGITYIRVRICGGGGGGGSRNGGIVGGTGGTTSFGSWTAVGGNGGGSSNSNGGIGGTGGVNGTGILTIRLNGGQGGSGPSNTGGVGGSNPFGGGAGPALVAVSSGVSNTGGGGAGGSGTGGGGAGGGAGEYVEFYVNSPGVTAYTVGVGGNGGTLSGGTGGSGVVIVEEFV